MQSSWMNECAGPTIVVVPCYNEELRLPVGDFRYFAERNPHFKFLMVNDGSQDGTAQVLGDLEAELPRSFEFLDLPSNVGKAEAIRQGFLHAFVSRPGIVGFWDADLSTPLEPTIEFENLLHRHLEIDMVVGTRMSLRGRKIQRQPIRKVLGHIFATVASTALGIRIRDTQCGAKFFRTSPDLVAVVSHPFLANWIFDVEVIARYRQLRKQTGRSKSDDFIFEAPLERWEEIGSSRLKSQDFVTALFDLLRIYWRHVRPGAYRFDVNPATTAHLDETQQVPNSTRQAA